jgi:hypothetical protein
LPLLPRPLVQENFNAIDTSTDCASAKLLSRFLRPRAITLLHIFS